MSELITVELTEQEARLLLNTIRARAIYKPVKLPLGGAVWYPWMDGLLQKLKEALPLDEFKY
ncbi:MULTISPECIES: hypothetical protein [unclassified Synechococcus]|jgi:hypothetical protein|uniref:hypothetical protein n=1 Tax=unclassified Synechococcus TaxID=2626047 RepID=UPI0020013F86|nr:hypothetical protein [Synechococcus sp. A10-1-5-1]UPM50876.1 hypothetical protein MY494_03580 [Synechococcus sp. A10-1-5-1]